MDDLHTKTISHLLAINRKGDTKVTQEALDQWYTAQKKDYAVFADRDWEVRKKSRKMERNRVPKISLVSNDSRGFNLIFFEYTENVSIETWKPPFHELLLKQQFW